MTGSARPFLPGILAAVLGLSAATGEEVAAESTPAELVAALGHERFAVREAAAGELLRRGRESPRPIQELCLRHFRESDDPEVRLRCRDILRDLLLEPVGFIGIRHRTLPLRNDQGGVDRIVEVTQVLPGLPAERGGLRHGDRVLAMEDEPLAGPDPAADLSRRIGAAGPGAAIRLEILRDGERSEVEIVTKLKPAEFQDIDPDRRLLEWLEKQTEP